MALKSGDSKGPQSRADCESNKESITQLTRLREVLILCPTDTLARGEFAMLPKDWVNTRRPCSIGK